MDPGDNPQQQQNNPYGGPGVGAPPSTQNPSQGGGEINNQTIPHSSTSSSSISGAYD